MGEPETKPAGDDQTRRFIDLLGQHERQLRAFVVALVPHWDDADEILQQTRIRLWEQFGQYDQSKDFGVWARVIARYQVLTFREQASRGPRFVDPEFIETIADSFEANADRVSVRYRAFIRCLEKVDAAKRQIFMRYYSGNKTMDELSSDLGMSAAALKQSIYRMRMELAKCIERSLPGKEDD